MNRVQGLNGKTPRQKHLLRGVLAGVAAGLVASWVMDRFITGPGKQLQKAVQSPVQNREDEEQQLALVQHPQPDATMKAADAVASVVTGGRHLSWEEKQVGGPLVHYAFGALMGGVYGGLAEYAPAVTAGVGTKFGAVLFGGADVLAVPIFGLGQFPDKESARKLATPFAAHVVYGATTEIVRRLIRFII